MTASTAAAAATGCWCCLLSMERTATTTKIKLPPHKTILLCAYK